MAKIVRTWSDKYDLVDNNFDAGGNGNASRVKSKDNEEVLVLKELRNLDPEKKGRFIEEIDIMSNNYKKIDGIMPVYDFSKEEYWYVMPEAELLTDYIKRCDTSFDDRIDLIISYAKILKKLHDNGISHRDIKPLNLYILNDKPYFGDFGLADFPDNDNDFTKSDKGLGAIFTIAPEMKRDPKHSDGKKADVYSFAKTVWMIITLDEKGFDGQYNRNDPIMSISKISEYKSTHLQELEDLLTSSTSNNPDARSDMNEFLNQLIAYKGIKADHYTSQLSDWNGVSKQIFGENEPSSCYWEDLDRIITILNIIGKNPAYNHMFYASKGGLDFTKAKKAAEDGCIELYTGVAEPDIVKPKRLIYQGFGADFSWNYFLLELDELRPIEPFRWDGDYEVLVEDTPAHYVSADYYQYGVYDYDTGEKLPGGWKLVRRFKTGKMLFILKAGGYNSVNATYDGRHAKCSSDEFKEYIQEMIKAEKWAKEHEYDVRTVLNHFFSKNPFVNIIEKEEDDDKNAKPMGNSFIENNYYNWTIDIGASYKKTDSRIRFKIVFDDHGGVFDLSRLLEDKKEILLSKDGTFKSDIPADEIMWLYSRKDVIDLEKRLNELLEKKCIDNGYIYPEFSPYINIEFEKNGNPNHLFTYSELVEALSKADARNRNTVVINENGILEIVEENERLYPVRNEVFQPGNTYVGKYADVKTVADDLYPSLLGKWLAYLKSGRRQHIDYLEYSGDDIEKLVDEIKEYMRNNP